MAQRIAKTKQKHILFVVAEREVAATSTRLLQVPLRLAAMGYHVDVITQDEAFIPKLTAFFQDNPSVTLIRLEPESRLWTMQQRDGFAKTFIKLFYELKIPGSDMYFWKSVAFDDFLWNVSRTVLPDIEQQYDSVWMPIPSSAERPNERSDVMYTAAAFYCKQKVVPLIGLLVYPVTDMAPIYLRIADYWIVANGLEGRFFTDKGIKPERVMELDGLLDRYCISSVDDAFSSLALEDKLKTGKDTLAISIINHPSNRMQIKEIIRVVGRLKKPIKLFFVFVGNNVREFTELNVFDDLIAPLIRQEIGDYYSVEIGGLMRVVMASDVIVSTSYIIPLSFAKRYGKCSIVYDPLSEPSAFIENVEQLADMRSLQRRLREAWDGKQNQTWLEDVARRIHT